MLRVFRDGAGTASPGASSAGGGIAARGTCAPAGVAAGDRVVIVSENRPEYPIAETALMAIRAVPVPAYTTNTVDRSRAHPARLRRAGGDRVIRRPLAGQAARGRRTPAGSICWW